MGASRSAPDVKSPLGGSKRIAGSGRAGGMFGAAGGGGIPAAISMITKGLGGGGKASFKEMPQEKAGGGIPTAVGMITKGFEKTKSDEKNKANKENDFRTFKVSKDLDYESTKKRLLELAKEEAIKISRGKDIDSKIYRESLPDSSGENQKTAEMFLGKDYKKNVQKSIDDLPTPIQGMFGGGA
tara:strand:- start:1611 stop:2162 length:552 start_codon:yes stop_codon:yes gene_type:complete